MTAHRSVRKFKEQEVPRDILDRIVRMASTAPMGIPPHEFHCGPMADQADCAIVATYAMLAAESLGLGSCMLGTTAALTQDKRMKDKLGIPRANKVGVALILGYPAVTFRAAVRRRLAEVRFVE